MKRYARLRQDCAECDNVLYNGSPEDYSVDYDIAQSPWRISERSALPQRDSSPNVRPTQPASSSAAGPPFPNYLTEAFKMLAAPQDDGSRRFSEQCEVGAANDDIRSRSSSERWPNDAQDDECDSQGPKGSGRWGSAETASLCARWGSVSTNDQWDEAEQGMDSFRDPLSPSPSSRLSQEEKPRTGSTTAPSHSASIERKPSLRNAPSQEWLNALTGHASPTSRPTVHAFPDNGNNHLHVTPPSVQRDSFLRETQGWLTSVIRPLQSRKHNPWEDPSEFNWRAAATLTTTTIHHHNNTIRFSHGQTTTSTDWFPIHEIQPPEVIRLTDKLRRRNRIQRR
ncbi:uncharacterized protein [Physcomitrium patens]|uniref:Uncharacterized protein n=1 Tax=Physcomitrium patens TaxID=3218 RepID=A0A2K1JU74_PHYPA|nr:uncharacterized protein LOC112288236 [Physcomitrium patens]PNR45070.1 hypothetical protein PHYPA_014841 [Physcomitrium patens]|eukprot:XP_024387998.1 uncharacterized protein LOC112288236 [Physcomitrella patens]